MKQRGQLLSYQIEKGSLNDIFIEMASTENQNENILQKVEIPDPVLSKPKTVRGSLYMFWKEDCKYGFCSRIPFAIVFVLIVAAVVGLSQLL